MQAKMNLYQKLHHIQKNIKGLSKDKASNNYKYVTGDKVLEHIKPLMNDLGLILKQEVIRIENERMDYKTGVGTSYEKPKSEILSKVMMRFTWIDCESGTKDENLFGANGQNDWEKGLGSALTYGERYFLLKFFHIATDEDDIDNPDRKPEPKEIKTEVKSIPKPFDHKPGLEKINACLDLPTLGKVWEGLTPAEKNNPIILAQKDLLKQRYSKNDKA